MFEIKVSQEIKECLSGFCRSSRICSSEEYCLLRWTLERNKYFHRRLDYYHPQMADIKLQPVIAATREAYKRCGKDPGRYRPSARSAAPSPDAWHPFVSD